MANYDLGTIGFTIQNIGGPQATAEITQLANAAETKLSPAAQRVIDRMMETRAIMQRVEQQTQSLNRAFSSAEISQAAQRMQGFENALANSRGGMNQFGVVTQQAGYQVGDFLVQVQSGTNWLVAFGQQATQLVGTLPMMTGFMGLSTSALVGLSAGLGIIIPLVTAFGAAWMRTSEEADKSTESVETLSSVLSNLDTIQQSISASIQTNLVKAFGDSAQAVGQLIDKLREAEFEATIRPLRESLDQISVGIDQVNVAAENILAFESMASQGQVLSQTQQRLLEESRQLVEENLSLAFAYEGVSAALDKIGQSKSSAELVENFSQAIQVAESLGGPVADALVEQLISAAREAGLLEEVIRQAEGAAEDFNNTNMSDGLRNALSVAQQLALATREALFPKVAGRGDPREFEKDSYWKDKFLPSPEEMNFATNSGSSGGVGRNGQLESLINQLQTERETLEAWYAESQQTLLTASETELAIIGGSNEAKLRLQEEYYERLRKIDEDAGNSRLALTQSILGGIADIAAASGGKMEKASRAFAAAEALINVYRAQAQVLADPKLSFFQKIPAMLAVGAAGMRVVQAIRSGSGATGGAVGGRGSATVNQATQAAAPQTVFIDSIDPEKLYSGETLINLFDAFYDENDKRGKVFVVAR